MITRVSVNKQMRKSLKSLVSDTIRQLILELHGPEKALLYQHNSKYLNGFTAMSDRVPFCYVVLAPLGPPFSQTHNRK